MPTVLVVEDSSATREALARLLQREGYAAAIAINGRDAVAQVRSGLKPDLVLMDIEMPEMDGLTALRLLRQEPGCDHTPVVVYTSLNDPETVQRARQLGAAAYVLKGITWPNLRDTVRRYVA